MSEEFPEFLNASKDGDTDLRRDLKKARHQLKQYETKIRNIEEEHKQQLLKFSSQDGPKSEFGFNYIFNNIS